MISRRNFLKTTTVTAALTAVGFPTFSASPKKKISKVPLKLSFQENTPPGNTLNEKFDYMEKLGVVGFEPWGKGLSSGRVKELQSALKGRNIKVSAICAGFEGFILSENPEVRQKCITTMKEIIVAAGELESTGVIIVPAFNGQVPAMPHNMATRDFLCEQFVELGNFAKLHGTTVILEPLNRKECFYLRLVADAAALCKDMNNDGVRCLGDFWHMTWEETSDMGAFLSGGKYLQHIHVASRRTRNMPGEDGEADNYVEGFRGLQMINYDKYVSFECGCKGDKNVIVPAAVKLLRQQWEEAQVEHYKLNCSDE